MIASKMTSTTTSARGQRSLDRRHRRRLRRTSRCEEADDSASTVLSSAADGRLSYEADCPCEGRLAAAGLEPRPSEAEDAGSRELEPTAAPAPSTSRRQRSSTTSTLQTAKKFSSIFHTALLSFALLLGFIPQGRITVFNL